MTSQLKVALTRKLHGSLVYLAYVLACFPLVIVQPDTGRSLVALQKHTKPGLVYGASKNNFIKPQKDTK